MSTMTDERLDAMLTRFLDAQAAVVGSRAAGERTTVDALRRKLRAAPAGRSWLLVAAALLLTGGAALGLVAGAAMLREQATTTAPAPSAVLGAIRTGRGCQTSLPGTWVVLARWEDGAGRWSELVVHEDGSVYERVDPGPWEHGPLTVRRLTPAGLELVREAVLTGVDGDGCPQVRVPGARPHHVVARAADRSSVAGFDWGLPYEAPLLPATKEHQAIVSTLGERLEDLGAWLPAAAWEDATARPYVGQWLIDVQQRYRRPDSSDPVGNDPTGLGVVGDPEAFGWFGRAVIGTPDGPPTAATTVMPERCRVSDAETTAEVRAEIAEAGAVPPRRDEPGWRFTVQADPPYDVIVKLVALRPGELSCLDYQGDSAPEGKGPRRTDGARPPAVVEAPRTDQTLVCWWRDVSWPRPPSPRTLLHEPCSR